MIFLEYYLAFGDKKQSAARVCKKIKDNEFKKHLVSSSNCHQRDIDARNRRKHYKDAAKFHNKIYPHDRMPEWKFLPTVLMFDMQVRGKIYTALFINNTDQDITFTLEPLVKLGYR